MKLQEQNQNQQPKPAGENQGERIITWQEYSNHITGQDCWVLIDGYLYNVSDYLVQHPGGDDILLKYSGLDASQPFEDHKHSSYAVSLRNARKVGKIENPQLTESYRQMLEQKKKKLREAKKSTFKKTVGSSKNLTIEQVAQHNSEKSCWIILQNKVYDVTNYMGSHPGGEGLILDKAGKDATAAFKQAKHSEDALQKRDELLIGRLAKPESKTSNLVVIVFALIAIALIGFFAFKML